MASLRKKLARLPPAAATQQPQPKRPYGQPDARDAANVAERVAGPGASALFAAITRQQRENHAAPSLPEGVSKKEVSPGSEALLSRSIPGSPPGSLAPFVAHAAHARMDLLSLLALDPALATVGPTEWLYLDTETTGLAGGTGTLPFVIGLGYFGPEGWSVEQLFVPEFGKEGPALGYLQSRLAKAGGLVSFNGKSFDWPLLRSRLILNRQKPPENLPHLDLLHLARRIHGKSVPNHRLGTLERHILGFQREGDVASAEIGSIYRHYLRTRRGGVLNGVFRHNEWDMWAMLALVGLYGQPLQAWEERYLTGASRTLKRAKALELAREAAERASAGGEGWEALMTLGEVAGAQGDRLAALAAYEAALEELNDGKTRLALAKLYEHFLQAPERARAIIGEGTSEKPLAHAWRASRLERKMAKAGRQLKVPLQGATKVGEARGSVDAQAPRSVSDEDKAGELLPAHAPVATGESGQGEAPQDPER